MTLVVKDRVRETGTGTGTGAISLGGAGAGFQSFSVVGDGNATYYTIVDAATGDWEVGIGTYTASGTTLSRDTVLESSSGGTAVSFAAGVKDVFGTYPAERSVYVEGGTITPAFAATLPVGSGGTGASTAPSALTNLGAYPATNPDGYTSNTGTVTSVGGTGTVNGISLSGTVTTSGDLTLGGTLSDVDLTTQITGTLPIANGGTNATTAAGARTSLGLGSAAVQNDTRYAHRANNLSDLNSAATARTNLGLGTAATTNSTDYATAAQGDLADTALQPADVGTIASQNANNVNITGGSVSGITDLAIADGGTGASTASGALSNIGGFPASAIPSGTKMLFIQTTAPAGWTKETTNDNKALRVVTGTAGTGGSVAFTTAFSGSNTVDGHAISEAQMPSHNHAFSATTGSNNRDHDHGVSGTTASNNRSHNHSVGATTGSNNRGHTHTYSANTGGISANHSHSLTGNAVAATDAFFVGSGGSTSLGGGSAIGETLNQSNSHVHGVSGTTNGQSANHEHSFSTISGNQRSNHEHTFSTTSGTQSENHEHSVSGTTGNRGSGSAHSHTTSNFEVAYVDAIIATKD